MSGFCWWFAAEAGFCSFHQSLEVGMAGSLEAGTRATISLSTQQLCGEMIVRALRGTQLAQGIVALADELVVSSDSEGQKL